jgi:hypothetical protein
MSRAFSAIRQRHRRPGAATLSLAGIVGTGVTDISSASTSAVPLGNAGSGNTIATVGQPQKSGVNPSTSVQVLGCLMGNGSWMRSSYSAHVSGVSLRLKPTTPMPGNPNVLFRPLAHFASDSGATAVCWQRFGQDFGLTEF